MMLSIFSCASWPSVCCLWRNVYLGLLPIFFFNLVDMYLYLFVYLFLAALGLRCCARAFSSFSKRGPLWVAVHGLLIAVASRCRAQALGARTSAVVARGHQSTGSAAVAPSCSAACGIFPDQGSKSCRLRWQAPILNHCATREALLSLDKRKNLMN